MALLMRDVVLTREEVDGRTAYIRQTADRYDQAG